MSSRTRSVAESLGYERVWLYDSPVLYGDVWVHLARIADATTRIGLGPAVLVPNLRHPVTQAAAIATVAALAPGRLAVAIGTGFTARMAMGQRPLTWADTRTYIAQVRGLLDGESMVVDGKVVTAAARVSGADPTCARSSSRRTARRVSRSRASSATAS